MNKMHYLYCFLMILSLASPSFTEKQVCNIENCIVCQEEDEDMEAVTHNNEEKDGYVLYSIAAIGLTFFILHLAFKAYNYIKTKVEYRRIQKLYEENDDSVDAGYESPPGYNDPLYVNCNFNGLVVSNGKVYAPANKPTYNI